MRIPADAWGDVGKALYDVPDVELSALHFKLTTLAAAEPGRSGAVLRAFAGMVETEQEWRKRDGTDELHQRRQRKAAS